MTIHKRKNNEPQDDHVPSIDNYIGGKFVPTEEYMPVVDPSTNTEIAKVALSNAQHVEDAVGAASKAFLEWSRLTIKARAQIMLQFHALIRQHADELAHLIVKENGKNYTEAMADIAKGNETVEWACSLPQLAQGKSLQVSTQVTCVDRRDPLGVVVSIVPFNFPFMVPMVSNTMLSLTVHHILYTVTYSTP
jgi:acyl-CoA reductase-like NAD-dependent aldehyde dehydrogenase